VTNKTIDVKIFLNAIKGKTPYELIISYYNFLANQYPGIQIGLYEYGPAPDYSIHLAGNDNFQHETVDVQNKLRFVFPLPGSNSGYILNVHLDDSTDPHIFAEYGHYFGSIFGLVLDQIQSSRKNDTELTANVISQISHDLNALINLKGETPDERYKQEQKKISLGKALPRLLFYLRPIEQSLTNLSVEQLFNAIIDKYTHKSRLQYELSGNLNSFDIFCDVELIDMAITELLDNAVYASQIQGGEILFSVRYYEKPEPVPSRYWLEMEIRNPDGSIPQEFLHLVKEPFFSTWRNEGKSGMGLALANRIAISHGGILDIKSDPDFGVKQIIFLPIIDLNEKT